MDDLGREITQMKRRKLMITLAGFLSIVALVVALIAYPLLFAGDGRIGLYETIGIFLIAVVALVTLALRRMLSGYVRFLESPQSEVK